MKDKEVRVWFLAITITLVGIMALIIDTNVNVKQQIANTEYTESTGVYFVDGLKADVEVVYTGRLDGSHAMLLRRWIHTVASTLNPSEPDRRGTDLEKVLWTTKPSYINIEDIVVDVESTK